MTLTSDPASKNYKVTEQWWKLVIDNIQVLKLVERIRLYVPTNAIWKYTRHEEKNIYLSTCIVMSACMQYSCGGVGRSRCRHIWKYELHCKIYGALFTGLGLLHSCRIPSTLMIQKLPPKIFWGIARHICSYHESAIMNTTILGLILSPV